MKQKVVLITGASSGIGEATARTFADAGYRVFGGVRTPDVVTPIRGVEFVPMDVKSEASVKTAVDDILNRAGRIDVLVNNAGISLIGPVEATSDAEVASLFDVNVFGVLRAIRSTLPAMRHQRSGLIVNISSVLGFLPAPFMGLYASSKHALEGLSESLDHEVRAFGVRVVLIEPSFTRTKLDTNATRTKSVVEEYASDLACSVSAVRQQVDDAPEPGDVAKKILSVVDGPHRLRQPADGRAKLLSFLRRFAPSKQVDKSLRKAFGLNA